MSLPMSTERLEMAKSTLQSNKAVGIVGSHPNHHCSRARYDLGRQYRQWCQLWPNSEVRSRLKWQCTLLLRKRRTSLLGARSLYQQRGLRDLTSKKPSSHGATAKCVALYRAHSGRPATENGRLKIRGGTWNVRTLPKPGRHQNLKREMTACNATWHFGYC